MNMTGPRTDSVVDTVSAVNAVSEWVSTIDNQRLFDQLQSVPPPLTPEAMFACEVCEESHPGAACPESEGATAEVHWMNKRPMKAKDTSKCKGCHCHIVPGAIIARPFKPLAPGEPPKWGTTWMHLGCARVVLRGGHPADIPAYGGGPTPYTMLNGPTLVVPEGSEDSYIRLCLTR